MQNEHLAVAVIYDSVDGTQWDFDSEESTLGAEQQGTNIREEQQKTKRQKTKRQNRARFGRTKVRRHGRTVRHVPCLATRHGARPARRAACRGSGRQGGRGPC